VRVGFVVIVLFVVLAGLFVAARRGRAGNRRRHVAGMRAEGRLPDDVESALRRASRSAPRPGGEPADDTDRRAARRAGDPRP
jgi:hypothetical protein